MTNIYISGPMAGTDDANKPAFDAAEVAIRSMGYEVRNPISNKLRLSYREAMACDLAWICREADAIAMLPGWRSSPGALAEHALAVALRVDIFFWPSDAWKMKRAFPVCN